MTERDEIIFIEHKPENFQGPDITVTITCKPSKRHLASMLKDDMERLLGEIWHARGRT